MEILINFGQSLAAVYKKAEVQFNVVFRLIAGLFVFGRLSVLSMGSASSSKVLIVTLCCAVLTTLISPSIFMVLAALIACFYLSMVSVETALVAFIFCFLLFVFYVRIFPKESLVIPVMLTAYFFKIPYVVPVFAALYIGVRAIVPVGAAVFIWSNTYLLKGMAEIAPKADFTPLGILDSAINIYEYLQTTITGNGWVFVAIVFCFAVIVGWVISNVFADYERELAIAASGIIIIFGLLIAVFVAGAQVSVIGAILGTIVSCGIVYVVQSMDFVLDYSSAQRVKFQDDNYYYYVKAVPKIKAPNSEPIKQEIK
ncbi:MAG: hypothetical protein AB7E42_07730 [Anaerotignaceae bacterium]